MLTVECAHIALADQFTFPVAVSSRRQPGTDWSQHSRPSPHRRGGRHKHILRVRRCKKVWRVFFSVVFLSQEKSAGAVHHAIHSGCSRVIWLCLLESFQDSEARKHVGLFIRGVMTWTLQKGKREAPRQRRSEEFLNTDGGWRRRGRPRP